MPTFRVTFPHTVLNIPIPHAGVSKEEAVDIIVAGIRQFVWENVECLDEPLPGSANREVIPTFDPDDL